MNILLVEDDSTDADDIIDRLESALDARVRVVRTEKEFLASLEQLAAAPPDVIILDVMLRWTDASPDVAKEDMPAEVQDEGFYVAGLRCVRYLRSDPRTAAIPYVLYTGIGENEFQDEIVVTKSADFEPLIRAITERCRLRSRG